MFITETYRNAVMSFSFGLKDDLHQDTTVYMDI